MLLDALQDHAGYDFWMECGGIATLDSFEPPRLRAIPEEHIEDAHQENEGDHEAFEVVEKPLGLGSGEGKVD